MLSAFRNNRFRQQIASNPYFFNGPFTGVAVQPAAYSFIYRFMANHTAEYPDGILNQDVLRSFFAITGDSGSFENQHGWERIPDNWYRRAIGDEVGIPYLSLITKTRLTYICSTQSPSSSPTPQPQPSNIPNSSTSAATPAKSTPSPASTSTA